MRPKTLLQLAGVTPAPSRLADAAVVVIDAQNEYTDGPLALPGVGRAVAEIAGLIARARLHGAPVVHVKHVGRPGGAFDPEAPRGAIIDAVAPAPGEHVVEKRLPNAFAGTDLGQHLTGIGRSEIVVVGFMTHMCVEATTRSAVDHGLKVTVVAAATATRDLPDPIGDGTVPAAEVQRNALAALADRFATVVATAAQVPD